jgi:glycosyltransferase involved in cell wall biosynthesis
MYLNDEYGCGHYRARFPSMYCFDAISNSGGFIECSQYLTSEEMNFDSYIFQRTPSFNLNCHVDRLKFEGKKLVWQIDDDLWNMPTWMPSQEAVNRWGLDKVIGMSDQIWVSTEALAKKINKPNTKILPNLVDFNAFDAPKPLLDDVVRILWAGGISHEKDLEILLEPMHRLLKDYGNKLQFVFWGHIHTSLLEYMRVSGLYAQARVKESYGHTVCYLEGLPFRNYYQKLVQMRPHIALCPIVDHPFNHSKSNLKFLEMTMSNAAIVASDIGPYKCIEHGHEGILVNNDPDSWYSGIKLLIDDLALRDKLAKNARKKVFEQYSWQSPAKQVWIDAFKSLL